jgi:hypothetical protein
VASAVRSVLAVLAGVAAAIVLIFAVEFVNTLVFCPSGVGVDPNDREKLKEMIAGLPVAAFLVGLAGYALGACVGGGVAAWLAGKAPVVHAVVVGVLLLAGAAGNLLTIPHPLWFAVVNLASYLPSALLGAWVVRRLKRPEEPTSRAAAA